MLSTLLFSGFLIFLAFVMAFLSTYARDWKWPYFAGLEECSVCGELCDPVCIKDTQCELCRWDRDRLYESVGWSTETTEEVSS